MEFELTVIEMADIACDYQEEVCKTGEVGKLCKAIEYFAQKELVKWQEEPCAEHHQFAVLARRDCKECQQLLIKHFELEGDEEEHTSALHEAQKARRKRRAKSGDIKWYGGTR